MYSIERVDESDCMYHIHNKVMYRIWFSEDEYDYIEDPVLVAVLDKFFQNRGAL